MAYAYASYVGGRLLVLVATAIIARLLTPSQFGVVALALTFVSFLDMLGDLGMSEALIILDEREVEARAETAFVVMLCLGTFLTALSVALGPVAARIYGHHALATMLPVLGTTFLLKSLGAAHYAIAQKRMDFRARTGAELVEVVVRGTVGIVLAFAGAGAWALVIGYVSGEAVMAATLWVTVKWRPHFKPRREHLRQLFGFGGALTGIRVVAALNLNVDKVVVGRVLGTAPLGLYTLASRLPELVLYNVTAVAGQVLFPAFAAVERPALGAAMVSSLRYAILLVLPLGAILAILAEPILVVAFGHQWRGAAEAMRLLSLMGVLSTVTLICGTIWKATGMGKRLLRFALLEMVTLIPAVFVFAHDGIAAVAACQAGSTVIVISVSLPGIMRMLDISVRSIAAAVAPPLVAGGAMVLVLLAANAVVGPPVPRILLGAGVGGAVYAAVLWLIDRETMNGIWRQVRSRLGRGGPPLPVEDAVEAGTS
ncbi:MAG: lipopolysaccharide biosynthesis protein [Solirubrobacteraceae bacterium]|nr:lipopolysaccharide biosynthesis protein [Solirubrobacteraceae bacterium]